MGVSSKSVLGISDTEGQNHGSACILVSMRDFEVVGQAITYPYELLSLRVARCIMAIIFNKKHVKNLEEILIRLGPSTLAGST